jgi:hypothetical protein
LSLLERGQWASTVRWSGAATAVLLLGIAALAAHRLAWALPHAIADIAPFSAMNVAYRYDELTGWFAGELIYRSDFGRLTYPPATYVFLWPILGWLPYGPARLLYVCATIAAALAAAILIYRAAAPMAERHRLLVVAGLAASYPLQSAVFLGHVLPFMVIALAAGAAAILLSRTSVSADIAAAACLALSLSKPTLAPPLVAAILISAWRWRPTVLTAAFYGTAAVAASLAHGGNPITLHLSWLRANNQRSVDDELGSALPNVHGWLDSIGFGPWGPLAALVILAAFCAWAMQRRSVDVWVLLGIAAVVARLWSYHRPYDDAVLFLAALALMRLAHGPKTMRRAAAHVLLAGTCLALLTPTWALFEIAPTARLVVYNIQTALWIALLVFLLISARASTVGMPVARDVPA